MADTGDSVALTVQKNVFLHAYITCTSGSSLGSSWGWEERVQLRLPG